MDAAASQNLQYFPLRSQEIRLATILPGDFETPIQCTISYHLRSDLPTYDALSYMWGNPKDTTNISVDGEEFHATTSLVSALRHIRRQDEALVLWIDALCINQADNEERGQQVQMMGDVYKSAKLVRVWAGREIEDSDAPDCEEIFLLSEDKRNVHKQMDTKKIREDVWNLQRLVETFGTKAAWDEALAAFPRDGSGAPLEGYVVQNTVFGTDVTRQQVMDYESKIPARSFWSQLWAKTKWVEKSMSLRDSFEYPPTLRLWRKLARLFRRPYWNRVWIMQEILNAVEVLIHFGKDEVSLDSIFFAHLYILMYDARCSKDGQPELQPAAFVSAGMSAAGLCSYRRELLTGVNSTWMLRLLSEQIDRFATDPRDKIYALIGIVKNWQEGEIKVDYNISPNELYIHTFQQIVDECKVLDVLTSQRKVPGHLRLKLPSWCPDWGFSLAGYEDVIVPNQIHRFSSRAFYLASGKSDAVVEFSDDGNTMIAEGFAIDAVDTISDVFRGSWEDDADVRKEAQMSAMGAEEETDGKIEAVWRTLTVDRISIVGVPTIRPSAEFTKVYKDLTSLNESRKVAGEQSTGSRAGDLRQSLIDHFNFATRGRRFFVSKRRNIGLIHADIRTGDLICILFGCCMPIALRPQNDGFTYLGEVYLHGWMDGAAMELLAKGEFTKREFKIY